MKRSAVTVLAIAAMFVLPSCAGPTTTAPGGAVEQIDLIGDWTQTNSPDRDAYQTATITADEITIEWVNEAEQTRALYWAGTVEMSANGGSFAWESVNDTEQTEFAVLASDSPTKTFVYDDGVISYEATALGVTMAIELERD